MAQETYSPLFASVYTFNLIVGIGALALPRAFNDAGIILGCVLLLILCGVSYVTSTFVIEAMSIANAYQKLTKQHLNQDHPNHTPTTTSEQYLSEKKSSINKSIDSVQAEEKQPLVPTGQDKVLEDVTHSIFNTGISTGADDYEITEKYELGSMANMFFPSVGVVLYYIIVCLYLFGDLTIYAVAAPISVTKVVCDLVDYYAYNETDAYNETNGSMYIEQCVGSVTKQQMYYCFLGVFFLVVGPFCYLNMTKTKVLQIITTVMRHLAFAFMIILAFYKLSSHHNSDLRFADFKKLPSLFGISVYSFMCQHSLPGMVTPMRGKKWVYLMLAGDFAMSLFFYVLISVTGSLVFKREDMSELYSLDFFNPGDEIVLLIIGIYLALFPVFTLSTNFPIIAVTLRENLKSLVRLIFNSVGVELKIPKLVEVLLFPTITLLPPLAISYATQQDDLLVSITGSFPGVGVQYLIPAALVLMGRYTMNKKFHSYDNKYKSPFSHFIIVGIVIGWSFISVILIVVNMSLSPPKLNSHPIG